MKVLILAAGYGTRLYSLVRDTPKALLKVKGRPLVDYILDKAAPLKEVSEIILVTNDKFYSTFQEWGMEKTYPHPICIMNDGTKTPEQRLGSIGDIDFVLRERMMDEDLLVVGGDNLFDGGLEGYIDFAKDKSPSVSIGVYDIQDLQGAKKFGVVGLDDQKKVNSFEEKPEHPKSTMIAMCFYYFPQKSLGLIAKYLAESGTSDTAGDYIRWLYTKNNVYGFQFTGKWYDVGSVETYRQAQKEFQG